MILFPIKLILLAKIEEMFNFQEINWGLKMNGKYLGVAILAMGMSACGSSGVDVSNAYTRSEFMDGYDKIANLDLDNTEGVLASDIQTSGSATYTGDFGIRGGLSGYSDDALIGEMNLNVNFGNKTASGSVGRFRDDNINYPAYDATRYDGEIAITNGEFDDSGSFTYIYADMDGRLKTDENIAETNKYEYFDVSGDMTGVFFKGDGYSDGILGSADLTISGINSVSRDAFFVISR